MEIDLTAIRAPRVRRFYEAYWPQRRILHDFYRDLPDAQYDYRMVETPERRSDSPRESLAHILYVQLVYLRGVQAGTVAFGPMGTDDYATLPKERLLAELERIEREMYDWLTGDDFAPARRVRVFWGGEMDAIDVLYTVRDHDLLHVGWNLAIMDHLNVPRFKALSDYWGP